MSKVTTHSFEPIQRSHNPLEPGQGSILLVSTSSKGMAPTSEPIQRSRSPLEPGQRSQPSSEAGYAPIARTSSHSPGHPLHPSDQDSNDLTSVAVSVSRCLEHSKRAQGEITGPVSQRFAGVPSIQMRWRFNNACASGMPGCYQCFMYR